MAITDADVLVEVQWRLLEDAALTSGLWTLTEIAALFNQRQNRFNRDTKLMLAQAAIPVAAAAPTAAYPQDWIATARASWKDTASGVATPVDQSDLFAAQMGLPSAAGAAPLVPVIMDENVGGTLTTNLFPPPVGDGTLNLLYASTLELLNFNPAAPDIFDVPDEFVPYLVYGVLEDLLSKEGRGQDLARAAYCRERYDEGVLVCAIMQAGFL